MATEAPYLTNPIATASAHATASARRSRVRRGSSGPDRLTVVLFSMAAFLVVLALLASQLRTVPARTGARPVLVLRKVYRTTVIDTTANGRGPGGTSVSQSVSSSSAGGTAVAPTTRSS